MLITIAATIVVLGILVLVHELGHFIAAKSVGIRVERFSIGFWPRIAGIQIGETDYCISAIPLGGYVKMAGMIDESMDGTPLKGEPWEFASKSTIQKLWVISAGVLMNILLAIVVFTVLIYIGGIGEVDPAPVVGSLLEDYPAEAAGLLEGDVITELDGIRIEKWDDLTEYIHARPATEVEVKWLREGAEMEAVITTKSDKLPVDGSLKEMGMIGISPHVIMREAGLAESFSQSVIRTYRWGGLLFTTIRMLVTGEAPLNAVGGPIFIAQLAGQSARMGAASLFSLIAILSVNLAVLNILPIPAFDGGHLVVIVIEGLKRKPLSVRTKMAVQQIGFALILVFAAIVIYNDLTR